MTEAGIGITAFIGMVVTSIDSLLWMLGGRKGKWKRRYIGAAWQTAGLNVTALVLGTWVWQTAATLGTEVASRVMGYGGDTTGEKILRRSIFAMCSLSTGVVLSWGLGFSQNALNLLFAHAVVSIGSIILGVKNPVPAAAEEVLVCMTLKFFNWGYLFIGV